MKKLLFIPLLILAACNSEDKKDNKPPVYAEANTLQEHIENYVKNKTNNPKFYKPLVTSKMEVLTDTLLIRECYVNKYHPPVVDFDAKTTTVKVPPTADIKEKFYKVLHSYEEQNNAGAIVKNSILLWIDDSTKVIASFKL